ncbi:MAG TPA: hypothetical protein VEL47_03110 [Myxococcota bacterium]|nr:hypothetical protein [Myxococcota bacterium]
MHNQRYIRGLWLIALALFGCTSEPTERRPDETVMHFPDSMALFNKTLAIASTSADREYSFGRLVTINTDSIKQAINDKEKKKPINWSKVVASNVLIPLEIGELSLTKNYLTFASRDNGQLIALPMSDGLAKCNGKDMEAASCPGAKSLMLPSEDPYAITKLPSAENEELVVVSYLSSDRIDVVKIGSGATLPMNIVKSFHSKDDWINKKFPSAKLKNQRIITRKTQVSFKDDAARSHVYFLLEQHPKKTNAPVKAKAAYLATVKIRDLLGEDLPASKVEVLNLKELFAISGVQDFYVMRKALSCMCLRAYRRRSLR